MKQRNYGWLVPVKIARPNHILVFDCQNAQ